LLITIRQRLPKKPKHLYHQKIPALKALNEQVERLLANYENNKGESATNRLRELVRAEQLNRMLESDPKRAFCN